MILTFSGCEYLLTCIKLFAPSRRQRVGGATTLSGPYSRIEVSLAHTTRRSHDYQTLVLLMSFFLSSISPIRAAAFVPAGLAIFLAGCGEAQKPQPAPQPPKVTVAKPIARTIVDQDEYVGRFVAVDSVEIRARVSGYLDKVHFQDGQYVKQGDILFTIDKRPFQNTFDQASANLETRKVQSRLCRS